MGIYSPQAPLLRRFTMADVQSKPKRMPNRYLLYALEGWGKSSFAAQAPKPIFLMTQGETGLLTLIRHNQLPEIPHLPELTTWLDLLAAVDFLLTADHGRRTVVIDTMNGAERLCHEHVCQTEFGGDWGDQGFNSFSKGPEVALTEWKKLLVALDRLRDQKDMTVFLLAHANIGKFKNPAGVDYNRYEMRMDKRTAGVTREWLDALLFGDYETTYKTAKVKTNKPEPTTGKAVGGSTRILHTERAAAYDAKQRLGLPDEIVMGNSAIEAWAAFYAALEAGRNVSAAVTPTTELTTKNPTETTNG